MKKTLEVDVRQVPTDGPILIVDDWMETVSQVQTAVDLIEEADGELGGIALLAAEENETTVTLDKEHGVYSSNPFRK